MVAAAAAATAERIAALRAKDPKHLSLDEINELNQHRNKEVAASFGAVIAPPPSHRSGRQGNGAIAPTRPAGGDAAGLGTASAEEPRAKPPGAEP